MEKAFRPLKMHDAIEFLKGGVCTFNFLPEAGRDVEREGFARDRVLSGVSGGTSE